VREGKRAAGRRGKAGGGGFELRAREPNGGRERDRHEVRGQEGEGWGAPSWRTACTVRVRWRYGRYRGGSHYSYKVLTGVPDLVDRLYVAWIPTSVVPSTLVLVVGLTRGACACACVRTTPRLLIVHRKVMPSTLFYPPGNSADTVEDGRLLGTFPRPRCPIQIIHTSAPGSPPTPF
jgi:hypothetical protein